MEPINSLWDVMDVYQRERALTLVSAWRELRMEILVRVHDNDVVTQEPRLASPRSCLDARLLPGGHADDPELARPKQTYTPEQRATIQAQSRRRRKARRARG